MRIDLTVKEFALLELFTRIRHQARIKGAIHGAMIVFAAWSPV